MSSPTQIALVITELEVGGAEQCLVNLACGLDRQRFAPIVYSLAPRPLPEQQTLTDILSDAGIPTRFVGVRSVWQFPIAVRRLRRMLAKQQPKIVQTFLFHANVVGALAARIACRPRVVQGMRVADPSRWRLWVERRLSTRVDRMACVSRSVADFYLDGGRIPADKTIVIPNGIDVTSCADVPAADLTTLGVAPDRQVFVYVGRLHKQKGLDWFLQLLPPVLAQLPDTDLLLVGQGPQRTRLESLAASQGIGERVHFVGWRSDVREILKAARLLVLPSRWEGMPNVVLEAMASGLPVVSTRAEGVVELLGEAAEEQTAPAGDAEAFGTKLRDLLGDTERASQLGQRNRDRAAQRFSLSAMIDAYQDLYAFLTR